MTQAFDEFERPVVILTSFGVPTAVSSAMGAYMILTDWPTDQRDFTHSFAMKACLAAARGEIEAETARGLFASWAVRRGVLASDVLTFSSSPRAKPPGV